MKKCKFFAVAAVVAALLMYNKFERESEQAHV